MNSWRWRIRRIEYSMEEETKSIAVCCMYRAAAVDLKSTGIEITATNSLFQGRPATFFHFW